jgi:hypothetical protein
LIINHSEGRKGERNVQRREDKKGGREMFGEFVKERRIARDITLRKFCQALDSLSTPGRREAETHRRYDRHRAGVG